MTWVSSFSGSSDWLSMTLFTEVVRYMYFSVAIFYNMAPSHSSFRQKCHFAVVYDKTPLGNRSQFSCDYRVKFVMLGLNSPCISASWCTRRTLSPVVSNRATYGHDDGAAMRKPTLALCCHQETRSTSLGNSWNTSLKVKACLLRWQRHWRSAMPWESTEGDDDTSSDESLRVYAVSSS